MPAPLGGSLGRPPIKAGGNSVASAMTKPRARLVLPVWGEHYVKNILAGVSLRALLAPGNLPSLAQTFGCEFVLLTERRFFPYLEDCDALGHLRRHARIELRAIDDLLGMTDYSVPLTLALFRGLEGLGTAATDTWVFFLNADFVLADGCYRSVVKRIEKGERLILAPSLRASSEDVLPMLRASVDPLAGPIAIPPRLLVRIALDHLHPMPRSKIVNRAIVHPHRVDQFYWMAGPDTLIGYQFPMTLVAVRPEQAPPAEPPNFFDYCSLPVLAPTARRCVLADSDEFFMLELQSRRTGLGTLRPGRPSVDWIAADMREWTTREQRELGRTLLTIHARALDAGIEPWRAEAERFVADLMQRLGSDARPHVDHGFWLPAYAQFKREYAARQGGAETAESVAAVPASFRALAHLRRIAHALLGAAPELGPLHPLNAYYRDVVRRIRAGLAAGPPVAVLPAGSVFLKLFAAHPGSQVLLYDPLSDDEETLKAKIAPGNSARTGFVFVELPDLDSPLVPLVRGLMAGRLAADGTGLVYCRYEHAGSLLARPAATAQRIDTMAPVDAAATVAFLGSAISHFGGFLANRLIRAFYANAVGRAALSALALALALPLVAADRIFGGESPRPRPTRYTTAMLLEINPLPSQT